MLNKENKAKAIGLAILIIFVGSLLFGLMYQVSIMTSIVILATTYMAAFIYSKNAKATWWTYVWITIVTILFAITAIIISTIIYIARNAPCSFSIAAELFFNNMKTKEMQNALLHDSLYIIGCAIFGLVIDLISLAVVKRKQSQYKLNQTNTQTSTQQNDFYIQNNQYSKESTNKDGELVKPTIVLDKNYRYFIDKITRLLNDYTTTKNQETFRSGLFEVKKELLLLDSMKKAIIENQAEDEFSSIKSDKQTKQANQILLKLIK